MDRRLSQEDRTRRILSRRLLDGSLVVSLALVPLLGSGSLAAADVLLSGASGTRPTVCSTRHRSGGGRSVGRSADATELVAGVSQICSPGAPGPVFPTSDAWWLIVGGDDDSSFPATFMMAREFGDGRVLVAGHDGYVGAFGLLDNGTLMLNTVAWLGSGGAFSVRYTTGHMEWVTDTALDGLHQALLSMGYSFEALPGPITQDALTGVGVLIVGNAWGAFTAAEIEAVREWVSQGGGVWLLGCGWSWEPYHPGSTLEDYPMMRIAAPYELRWLRPIISDPTHSWEDAPIFHTFYPNVESVTLTHAMATIDDLHATYGTALPNVIESDADLRRSFAHAHETLAIAPAEFPMDHPHRQVVFDYYAGLIASEPGAYAKIAPIDSTAYPTSVWLRERAWRTWHDCLALTPAVKTTMAGVGQLMGEYLDIFNAFDVVLLDDVALDAAQKDFVWRYLSAVPQALHTLRSISVYGLLGTPPLAIPLDGPTRAVNILGLPIGGASENSFPADVPPGCVDVFCIAAAHEVNHVVDVCTIAPSPRLDARRNQLIADAGEDPLNYLRSMFDPGTFECAPQEFFASIANEWFTDSIKTVQLGLVRFDADRPDPINQALFFADVYSLGGAETHVYTIDTAGGLTCATTRLGRNEAGFIKWIVLDWQRYSFTLDPAGRVLAYSVAPVMPGDLNCDQQINVFDIDPFVLAIADPDAYAAAWPDCDYMLADVNGDSAVNVFDIDPFVRLLTGD